MTPNPAEGLDWQYRYIPQFLLCKYLNDTYRVEEYYDEDDELRIRVTFERFGHNPNMPDLHITIRRWMRNKNDGRDL